MIQLSILNGLTPHGGLLILTYKKKKKKKKKKKLLQIRSNGVRLQE